MLSSSRTLTVAPSNKAAISWYTELYAAHFVWFQEIEKFFGLRPTNVIFGIFPMKIIKKKFMPQKG